MLIGAVNGVSWSVIGFDWPLIGIDLAFIGFDWPAINVTKGFHVSDPDTFGAPLSAGVPESHLEPPKIIQYEHGQRSDSRTPLEAHVRSTRTFLFFD